MPRTERQDGSIRASTYHPDTILYPGTTPNGLREGRDREIDIILANEPRPIAGGSEGLHPNIIAARERRMRKLARDLR